MGRSELQLSSLCQTLDRIRRYPTALPALNSKFPGEFLSKAKPSKISN